MCAFQAWEGKLMSECSLMFQMMFTGVWVFIDVPNDVYWCLGVHRCSKWCLLVFGCSLMFQMVFIDVLVFSGVGVFC